MAFTVQTVHLAADKQEENGPPRVFDKSGKTW